MRDGAPRLGVINLYWGAERPLTWPGGDRPRAVALLLRAVCRHVGANPKTLVIDLKSLPVPSPVWVQLAAALRHTPSPSTGVDVHQLQQLRLAGCSLGNGGCRSVCRALPSAARRPRRPHRLRPRRRRRARARQAHPRPLGAADEPPLRQVHGGMGGDAPPGRRTGHQVVRRRQQLAAAGVAVHDRQPAAPAPGAVVEVGLRPRRRPAGPGLDADPRSQPPRRQRAHALAPYIARDNFLAILDVSHNGVGPAAAAAIRTAAAYRHERGIGTRLELKADGIPGDRPLAAQRAADPWRSRRWRRTSRPSTASARRRRAASSTRRRRRRWSKRAAASRRCTMRSR